MPSAAASAGPFHRGRIEIAFPVDSVGDSLSTLLATVAGNLFELGEVTGLRLLDLDFTAEHAARFAGPQFGIEGTRRKAGVHGRPMIGSIVKPSIGLTPEDTAAVVDALCAADIDFIKDDELNVDPAYAPFEARLAAVMPVLHRHADRIGRMPMYAINISGGIDEMRRRHDAVLRAGRHLRDGQRQRGRHRRRRASAQLQPTADPRPPQRLGCADAPSRRSASTSWPSRSCGAWPAWTTCMSTACAASSGSPMTR